MGILIAAIVIGILLVAATQWIHSAFGVKITARVAALIDGFTLAESIVLTAWLYILFPRLLHASLGLQITAFVVLYVGILLEHRQATVVGVLAGKDNP